MVVRPPRAARGIGAAVAWIAPALALVLAGCGGKSTDIRADVQKIVDDVPSIVTDSVRAGKVREAYQRIGDVLVKSAGDRRELALRFRRLYRDYDAPRADLEQVIARIEDQSRAVRSAAVAAREEIRANTTEKEWKALASSRKRLGKLYLKSTP